MEIGLFTDSYLPTRDGTAIVVDGLARALVRAGHLVTVLAPRAEPGPTVRTEEDGVTVWRVRSHAVPLYPQYRSPYAASLFSSVRAACADRTLDVIHLHSPGLVGSEPFIHARRWKVPLVGTFHTHLRAMVESVEPRLGVPTFFRLMGFYSLGLYWRCDVTTAPTAVARSALLEHATKPFRRPIEIVPNGIDLGRFSPGIRVPDWRARCGLPDAPLVTYVGRLTIDKGIHRFLEAVEAALKRTDLVAIVAGSGPEEAAARGRIGSNPRLSQHVRYIGPVTEEEKPALLSQSDVFVLPSTSDTSSVSLLEAMACGVAVIGPTVGGPSEIIEDGVTGLRVPPSDPGRLADAIERLLTAPAERRQLADQARQLVVRTASIETMTSRFEGVYTALVNRARARRAPR